MEREENIFGKILIQVFFIAFFVAIGLGLEWVALGGGLIGVALYFISSKD